MRGALSGPLLLLGIVLGGWISGRSAYLGWQDVADAPVELQQMPGLLFPLMPDDYAMMGPRSTGRAAIAEPAFVQAASATTGGSRRMMTANHIPTAPLVAQSLSGGNSVFVSQQVMLLHRLLRPTSKNGMALMRGALLPDYRLAAPAAAPSQAAADDIGRYASGGQQRRWALAAWTYYRDGGFAAPLAGQSQIGGSQAGIRLSYILDHSGAWRGFARFSATPQGPGSVEAAAGLSLRPWRALPVTLVAERRQRLTGRDARSAFAAYVTGGASDVALPAGFRLDGYAAAGVVGLRRRDMFAEASLQSVRPLVQVGGLWTGAGAGVWGSAQPGASRLDVGPTIVTRFGLTRLVRSSTMTPRLSMDYRHRVAGDALPGSGIAVTLAADF